MRQELLLFISIMWLFAFNVQAEPDVNLPALPTDSAIGITDNNHDSDISFWQKTKNFFGFGDEENIDNKPELNIEEINNSNADLSNDISPTSAENSEDGPAAEQTDAPTLSAEEVNSIPKQSLDPKSSDDVLSIPKGFDDEGEELKLPSGFSEDNMEAKETDLIPEKTNELSGNIKKEIADSTEASKIPSAFDDGNIKTSKASSSETPEDIAKNAKEPAPKEVTEVQDPLPAEKAKEIPSPGIDASKDISALKEVLPSSETPEDIAKNAKEPAPKEVTEVQDPLPAEKAKEIPSPGIDASKDISALKEVLPIPDYAASPEATKEPETSVSKFAKTFESKKSNQIELPKITEEDFVTNKNGESVKVESIELDAKQLQFVNNEAQVLILPNDDVVLGELTIQSKINGMDLHSYIKKFWENYNSLKREPKRKELEQFIENYDENFNEEGSI